MNSIQKNTEKLHQSWILEWKTWGIVIRSVIFIFGLMCFLYAIPGLTQERALELSIIAGNGEQHNGFLLYAGNSLLVLWQCESPYKPDVLYQFAKPLHCSEIERIIVRKKSGFLKGFFYGLAIGGASGAIVNLVKRDDEESQLFWALNAGNRALKGGLIVGVPSAIVGGAIGAAKGKDSHFAIGGDGDKYRGSILKLKKMAVFQLLPPPELKEFIDQWCKEAHLSSL